MITCAISRIDPGSLAMDYKKLGLGLGLFSIALGAAELFASRRIAKGLSAEGHEDLIRGFGVREVAAGAGLLVAPAHSAMVWNRVLGDGMDLAALGAAARNRPENKAVWGALAFVIAATALDVVTALGLDRTTGKALPIGGDGAAPEPARDRATSVEPPHVASARAPVVA
jgi:hypothetical protein